MALNSRRSSLSAIGLGGSIAGVADLAGAYAIYRPARPLGPLHSIASGALGSAAFQGGAATAAIGLVAHFVVAFGAAAVFVIARRRLAILRRSPWIIGPLYGLVVWLVMNYGVIPMSAIGRFPGAFTTATALVILLHMVGVGLPIAWAAARPGPAGHDATSA
jgi:hypothetical protein